MISKKFHFDPNLGFLISVIISAILAGGGPTRLHVHSETEQVASKYKMRGVVVPPPVGHVSSLGHSSRTAIGHLYGTAIGLSYRTAIGHSYWTAVGHYYWTVIGHSYWTAIGRSYRTAISIPTKLYSLKKNLA